MAVALVRLAEPIMRTLDVTKKGGTVLVSHKGGGDRRGQGWSGERGGGIGGEEGGGGSREGGRGTGGEEGGEGEGVEREREGVEREGERLEREGKLWRRRVGLARRVTQSADETWQRRKILKSGRLQEA